MSRAARSAATTPSSTAYADLRSGERRLAEAMALAVSSFYGACDVVLSPSACLRRSAWRDRNGRRARPALGPRRGYLALRSRPARAGSAATTPIHILYSGRITQEKGIELLAEAFTLARAQEPRLHLLLAGGGPEQERLRERLGEHASFLGWLEGDELARAYADADIFLFPSATDTFGQVILEAQASGAAGDRASPSGGPLSLIEHRVSGLLCEADAALLADALLELAHSPLLREHLARGGLRGGPRRAPGSARSSDSPMATSGRSQPSAAGRAPSHRRRPATAPPDAPPCDRCRASPRHIPPDDRRRPARHRAGDLRALRGDPRLARRSRRRPRHAAGDSRARPAPGRRALPGDGRAGCASAAAPATRSPSTASSTCARARGRSRARSCSAARPASAAASSPGSTARRRAAPCTPAGV